MDLKLRRRYGFTLATKIDVATNKNKCSIIYATQ